MRRVIDEFRQLPMEDIAELLAFETTEDNYGEVIHLYTSNLLDETYYDHDTAVNSVIKYLEQSI